MEAFYNVGKKNRTLKLHWNQWRLWPVPFSLCFSRSFSLHSWFLPLFSKKIISICCLCITIRMTALIPIQNMRLLWICRLSIRYIFVLNTIKSAFCLIMCTTTLFIENLCHFVSWRENNISKKKRLSHMWLWVQETFAVKPTKQSMSDDAQHLICTEYVEGGT